jgi:hypothetical protein
MTLRGLVVAAHIVASRRMVARTSGTMSQVILAIHLGVRRDSSAAVLFHHEVKTAVALERLIRKKGDGTAQNDALTWQQG